MVPSVFKFVVLLVYVYTTDRLDIHKLWHKHPSFSFGVCIARPVAFMAGLVCWFGPQCYTEESSCFDVVEGRS